MRTLATRAALVGTVAAAAVTATVLVWTLLPSSDVDPRSMTTVELPGGAPGPGTAVPPVATYPPEPSETPCPAPSHPSRADALTATRAFHLVSATFTLADPCGLIKVDDPPPSNSPPAPTTAAPTTRAPQPTGRTPVAINGKLHVCGTKLCNQYNKPIQLRGMSTHGLQWYAQCLNVASLDALAQDWRADILRISMYIQEDGYESNPRQFTDLVHKYIKMVADRGLYMIVDWHQLEPGDPMKNLSRAKTFFTEIAAQHGNLPNILYEVANEPSGVTWSQIKSYHEQIIPVIRAKDPDSVILLGTRAWSSLGVSDGGDETEVIRNPVQAGNVMYTFHFYAASHGGEPFGALSRAADKIPMFVTEFGTQTYTGDGGNDFAMSQRYLDLMAAKKIGWTNWNYSDDERSGAVFKTGTCPGGSFAGTTKLKPAGVWIREHMRSPDDFPTG